MQLSPNIICFLAYKWGKLNNETRIGIFEKTMKISVKVQLMLDNV